MAKDKVFSKYAPTLSNDAAYQAYLDDQERRRKEAEQGQIRYTEAAKASRVQYSLPGYQGKSQNQGKTYQWERDLMQNEKIKGAGNSYTKKFDALTSRMGMTEGQASEFRKYMDFQEDSQHVDPKMNKDGSINQSQSLKYARDARLKTDVIDGILDNMHKTGTDKVKKAGEIPFKKVTGFDKLKNMLGIDLSEEKQNTLQAKELGVEPHYGGKKDKTDPVLKERWNELKSTKTRENSEKSLEERDGLYGLLDRYVLPISQAADEVLIPGNNDVQVQNEIAKYGDIVNPATKAGLIDRGLETKILHGAGTMAGYLAPYSEGYNVVNAALNLPKLGKVAQFVANNPFKGRAAVGGVAGTLAETGLAATNELANSEANDMSDYTQRIALGAAGGAIGDPLLHGAGKLLKGGLGQFAKVDGSLPEFSGSASDNILDSLASNQTIDKTLGGKISSPSDDLFARLQEQRAPLKINDWQDVAYGGNHAPNTNIVNNSQVNMPNGWSKDDIKNAPTMGGEKPKTPESQVNDEYVQDALRLREMTDDPAEKDALDNLIESITGKKPERPRDLKAEEDTFVSEQMKPHHESLQKSADAQAQWENTVKSAKTTSKQIKDNFGKIYVPSHSLKDYPVPKQFLAGSKDKHSDDIFSFADQMGFSSPDEAVQFLRGLDTDSKTKLKDIMPEGTLETKDLRYLEESLRKQFREQNVNNSQAPEQVLASLIRPKGETEAIKPPAPASEVPPKGQDMLLRMDLQRFESDAPSIISDQKPIQSVSAIDSIKNPIKRRLNKFYENAVNSTHSAKVAHTQVLENAIKKAEASGLQPKKVAVLKDQLKSVKKNGSDLEKSIQNQAAAGNKAKTFLDSHMDNLQNALGSSKPEAMAEAIRYQVAKNIRWIWDNVNPDYVVGGGWDKGRVNTIVNTGVGNPNLESFTDAMKGLTQERLDLALKHGLINKNAHAALSKNPFYIPMARDVTPGMDNVGRGIKEGTTKNKGQAGAYFIQSLGDGDAEALYKDPLESLMTGTFSLFKNIAKEDTHKQLYNMAKLDSDKLFSRIVSKKQFDSKGGIAVPTPKGTKYIQIQDDLQKMIQENDLPYDLNVLGKVTSAFAGLKTRSLEYHVTGVPRDLAEGYLKGQTNNPVKYLSELVKAAKEHNLSAKQAGAYFDNAYKDGMGGINQEKMMKEYARQNKNVKPFNPKNKESWKELTSTILRIADMPFKPIKAIGQLSDELTRTVEVKATKDAFMKQHGSKIDNIKKALDQVNAKIESSSQATDPFDPALQGIDKLKGQKSKLENMLNEYDKNLEREQTFRGRDIMNFSRAGRGGVAKHIRQYAIFANTTTQSKDKLVRSFIEKPGATIGKVALLTAPLVYAEHVMHQNLTDGDKKIYDNLPNWAKQYNYVYVHNGNVITVPKIQELALLTNPIEAILAGNKEDLNASARLAVKEAVPYQIGNIAQGLVPNTDGSVTMRKNAQAPSTIASPALDVMANDKLGFNRNAISFADKFGRQDAKANKFTLDVFKKTFGNKARADYAQYLATQYPGDAGKYGTHILDWLMEPGNDDKLDAMLQNLNPLQDRVYSTNGKVFGHKVFKNPPKKPAVKK